MYGFKVLMILFKKCCFWLEFFFCNLVFFFRCCFFGFLDVEEFWLLWWLRLSDIKFVCCWFIWVRFFMKFVLLCFWIFVFFVIVLSLLRLRRFVVLLIDVMCFLELFVNVKFFLRLRFLYLILGSLDFNGGVMVFGNDWNVCSFVMVELRFEMLEW